MDDHTSSGDGARAGAFVTETLPDYDGGHPVTAYVPATTPEAIVFTGDGQGFSKWGRLLETADVLPTMIVGGHGLTEEMSRLREYSPALDADRFTAHAKFFVEDVLRWVRSRFGVALPVERTAVFGYSAGGELALALGLRHPDIYGVVLSGSPGAGYQPPRVMPQPLPRVHLFAGTLEPFFRDNAARWADALRAAGADIATSERTVPHGPARWRADFPLIVNWAFGPTQRSAR
jgi:pimeloyl-ACP methyl ester carboxylesterase